MDNKKFDSCFITSLADVIFLVFAFAFIMQIIPLIFGSLFSQQRKAQSICKKECLTKTPNRLTTLQIFDKNVELFLEKKK